MVYSSRVVALLLGITISSLSTAFLSLTEGITLIPLVVVAMISFSSSYILIYMVLRFFIYDEINRIYKRLNENPLNVLPPKLEEGEVGINPIRQLNKEISRYTMLKEQEILELKKMESYRKEFLADVSHELKTPIFAAQGFIHTLLDGAIKDKHVRNRFLRKAAKSLARLDKLVQDLLVISQMEAGTITMNRSHFNIYSLANEVIDQFEDKSDKKGVSLYLKEVPRRDIFVFADRQKIFQVLQNLVSNGINYTSDVAGYVSIRFDDAGDSVLVEVEDNGIGIPQKDINRIFERFYRVDKSRSKDKGGTGLGLSIVKHILDAHNRKINVRSEPGKGSVFSFYLDKGNSNKAKTDEI